MERDKCQDICAMTLFKALILMHVQVLREADADPGYNRLIAIVLQ
jgi:hypothetical protein